MIRFMHIADLHIDRPIQTNVGGDYVQQAAYRSFERLVTIAIDEQLDFLLVVGDLVDRAERSVKAQRFLTKQWERLAVANIPVYIAHGHCDFVAEHIMAMHWPSNVTVFAPDVEEYIVPMNGEVVALVGFSYPRRAVTERMIERYPLQKAGTSDWLIGLLHGQLDGADSRSLYAPFSLADLQRRPFAYWALGHVHARQVVSERPLALYSGNIQGRHRKEQGEKGGVIVTLDNGGVTTQFVATSDVIWHEFAYDSEEVSFHEWRQQLIATLTALRRPRVVLLVTLVVTMSDRPLYEWLRKEIDAVIERWNEEEEGSSDALLLTDVVLRYKETVNRQQMSEQSLFMQQVMSYMTDGQLRDVVLQPLRQHTHARHYLPQWSEEEWQQIEQQALAEVIDFMFEEGQ